MYAYQVETTVKHNGQLTLTNLPFQSGEAVRILIFPRHSSASPSLGFPLQGKVLAYNDPFEPVAQNDWEVTA